MDGLNILTISGWTQPVEALADLAPNATHLDYATHTNLDEIAANLPVSEIDAVIGWSLGGIIARNLLSRGALKAKALIVISSPYQFVKNDHMAAAMPPDTFEIFYDNYANDTERTVQRFHGLIAKGDKNMRQVMEQLDHHPDISHTARWLPWMEFLRNYSSQAHDYHVPPTLLIHGAEDAIVPVDQSYPLAEKLGAEHIVMNECGHAPHLHDAQGTRSHIQQFLSKRLDA